MKITSICGVVSMVLCTFGMAAFGQGSFQNLDFESANLAVLQPGQSAEVAANQAFPGWAAFLEQDQQAVVLYNNLTIGSAAISILGPNFGGFEGAVLQGSFTAALAAGIGYSSASLRQTGLVPGDAQSLRVLIPSGPEPFVKNFEFSLDSVVVPLVPLMIRESVTVYGGDVSSFAGQVAELSISAYLSAAEPTFFGFRFDAIQFSAEPVPEPGTVALFTLGALFLGWRMRMSQCSR